MKNLNTFTWDETIFPWKRETLRKHLDIFVQVKDVKLVIELIIFIDIKLFKKLRSYEVMFKAIDYKTLFILHIICRYILI